MALRTLLPLTGIALLIAIVALIFSLGGRSETAPQSGRFTAVVGDPAERRGALVDEIVFTRETDPGRITALIERGSHHLYAQGLDSSALFRQIQDSPRVDYHLSYGTSAELTLNPAEFEDGRLNPFHVPAIREALNWLIDRRYIAAELFGGLATPRTLPIHTAFPDYARLAESARRLEIEYSHQPQRAQETLRTEMEALGAERRDGRWYYNDRPITLKVLIRTEDNRERVGDYIANLLDDLGFAIERLYRTADEATRIWIAGNPAAGEWHVYTGAWISTVINRDASGNITHYYTPRGRPAALWQAYTPSPELSATAERLDHRHYTTLSQRDNLLERGIELAMADSARIWLADKVHVTPHATELELAADLAGGVAGSSLWPYTIRFRERLGGQVVVATPSLLTEPWNPIAGTNWIFDQTILRALSDSPLLPDPFTGLYHPQRIDHAEVTVTAGTPITRSLDWLSLDTAETIRVPDDAWIAWDGQEGELLTVGEAHPEGLTARARTVLYYEDGYLERRWHDGSQVSLADLLIPWMLSFERADERSALYDPSHAPAFEVYRKHFRGWRITRTSPLTIEVYSDQIYPDAEVLVAARAPSLLPWHVLQLGIEAERRGELAFSSSKADRNEIEWLNWVSGPSLAVLRDYLSAAVAAEHPPVPRGIDDWLRDGEAQQRYAALEEWHRERGHFWVGDGPFYLHSVRPVEGTLVLRRFAAFPDRSDKWLRFTAPRIPELTVDGPLVVEHGDAVAFDLAITFGGAPYPDDEIEAVRFLLFDRDDRLAARGRGEPIGGGRWRLKLTQETVQSLGAGANSLEIAVTTPNVAMPAFATHAFATVPQRRAAEETDEGGAP